MLVDEKYFPLHKIKCTNIREKNNIGKRIQIYDFDFKKNIEVFVKL